MQPPKNPSTINVVAGILMGTTMAFLMSAFVTAINTGIEGDFIARWLRAFTFAAMAAVPLAILIGPYARKLATKLVGK